MGGLEERIEGPALIIETGSMFSGKTGRLKNRLDTLKVGGRRVQAFKHISDSERYGKDIRPHSGGRFPGIPVRTSFELYTKIKENTEVIGIDEIQFFDEYIIDLVKDQVKRYGRLVIVTFLNTDFRGDPFKLRRLDKNGNLIKDKFSDRTIEELLGAEVTHYINLQPAKCQFIFGGNTCGANAYYTQRLFPDGRPVNYSDPLILVGGNKKADKKNNRVYQARCFFHHEVPGKPETIFPPLIYQKLSPS